MMILVPYLDTYMCISRNTSVGFGQIVMNSIQTLNMLKPSIDVVKLVFLIISQLRHFAVKQRKQV
jgi:hypothetical protein